ncbi:MAG TPA: hypothetical protein VGI74_21520 [Streptosporangiaceae bacterium]
MPLTRHPHDRALLGGDPTDTKPESGPTEGFLRHRALIGVSAGLAMAEAVALLVLVPAATSLAPQVTALPPLAVFHDLRWLFGYNRSWLGFAAGAFVLVAARSALNASLVRLAWPRGLPAPNPRAVFAASLAFTVLAGLLMVPIVTLVFGVAVLPFSWPFLAAVPVMLAIALPLSHGGVTTSWWRRLPPGRAAGWALACFVEYSVLGIVLPRLPAAGAVLMAGLAGVVNARAWYSLAVAVAEPARPRTRPLIAWIPVAPLAAISVFALAIGTTRLIFDMAASPSQAGLAAASAGAAGFAAVASQASETTAPAASDSRAAVLVVAGFGSSCCHAARDLQRAASDMLVQQFSYRGLDAAGKPLAQGPSASDLPLSELGDRLATQVNRLHEQTGRPVNLVAESEGTLGIYAMFARHPGVPVGSIVLLSPIVAPGQASFPRAGRQGPGVASGYALNWLDRLVGELSPFGPEGASRLLDSVSTVGARYAASATRGKPHRWLAVVPLADAVTLPACTMPQSVLFVSAFHGGLLGDPAILQTVRAFLGGHQVYGQRDLRTAAELVSSAAAAWRMPLSSPPCPA